MSKLLIHEPPLQVLPSLAAAIGLNEALVLQQVHYRSLRAKDGWVEQNVGQWRDEFPFWSERTIKRVFASLREQGAVEVEKAIDPLDQTNRYRVRYEALPGGQVGPVEGDNIAQMWPDGTGQPGPVSIGSSEKDNDKKKDNDVVSPLVEDAFAYWHTTFGLNGQTKLTPGRRTKLRARLTSPYLGDSPAAILTRVKRAIDGCAGSDFHRKNNHIDLTLICRSDEKLEEFERRPAGTAAAQKPDRSAYDQVAN